MARTTRSLAALLVLALAACGRSSSTSSNLDSPRAGGTLIATVRSESPTFNRYAPNGGNSTLDNITHLTQATLVRVNRLTGDIEPWLAERWTTSADRRSYTLTLRDGVAFSDGVPLTADDVVFSLQAAYDPAVASVLASSLTIQGKPLSATAVDPRTVTITMPAPFTPGLALLDNLPIYPRHLLKAALDAHTFAKAWGLSTPPASMAGLGPFVIAEYVPGQRLVLTRNPHYWRKDAAGRQLPYLDRVEMNTVTSQDAEILRLESGASDLMAQADVRPEDYAALRRLRDQGKLQLIDLGVSVDPNVLWFNLGSAKEAAAKPYLQRKEFRQAIACAIDRDAIAATVYLGAAAPVYGPETPGNKTWYSASAPQYPHDAARARALLASIGLEDRHHDGQIDDATGHPVRFSILTQGGNIRERTATMIQEQLRQIGITVDVVALDPSSLFTRFGQGDYDSLYYGFQTSAFDPALNPDFWLSSGAVHVWNPGQAHPATDWEARIDDLMGRMSAAPALADRQRLFAEVQQVFGENLPEIALVAPRISVAMSPRVRGATPVLLDPKVLWNADTLYLSGAR